jgi:hypothetical protein
MVGNVIKVCTLFCLVSFLFSSCKNKNRKKIDSPQGYNFSEGKKLLLYPDLEEISGIAFLPGTDTMLLAVNDEEGKIFSVSLNLPKAKSDPFKFSGRGDYEDITLFNGKWRVMEGNGKIHSGDLTNPDWPKPSGILPKGEYEGMVGYNDTLFVICKECPGDKEGSATVYYLQEAADSLYIAGTAQLDAKDYFKGKHNKILPSALARHPISNEWYILSHLNGCLFVTDSQFNIRQFIKLPRSLFLQPEGIAFLPSGDLFLSNEGDGGAGYIWHFKNIK